MASYRLLLPQLLLASLCAVLLADCGPAARKTTRPARSTADARAAIRQSSNEPSLSVDRRRVLTEAAEWLGTPYRYGGSTPAGVDCSGFVFNVYRKVERKLPRSSSEQGKVGENIDLDDALPGDLVFFNTSGSGVSHVGILINADQFVHASTSSGVIVSSLGEGYYRERFMFVRRVL